MSVENELKERLNLQEGDEVTFVRELYDTYVKKGFTIFGLSPTFEKCKMDGNVIVKRQNGKMGMYTEDGEVVIPEDYHKCWPEFYDDIDQYYNEVICIQKDELVEVRSYDGHKQIIPRIGNKVFLYAWYIVIHNDDGFMGAYTYKGKQILPAELLLRNEVEHNDHFAFVCTNKDMLDGVYSEDGEVVIPFGKVTIKYREPFFEVTDKDGNKELYTFNGVKLPLGKADKFEWDDNGLFCTDINLSYEYKFIMAFKDGKRATLYTYDGTKVIPEPEKYAKMYLEKEYIICIGHDGVTMDVYNFEGKKIVKYKP